MGLLDEKPVLVTYVLCLELQSLNFDGEGTTYNKKDAVCVSVAGVVNRLSKVRKLSMVCVDWDTLSSTLETALTGMLSAPSMIDLTLDDFTIPTLSDLISLLSHAVYLKALKGQDVMFIKESGGSTNYTGPSPGCIRLDTLFFGGSEFAFLAWFQQQSCFFRFENLRSLKIWVPFPGGFEITAFLLQQAGHNLIELELYHLSITSETMPESTLTYLRSSIEDLLTCLDLLVYVPNLKSIQLVGLPQEDSYTPVPSILSLFKPHMSSDLTKYPLQHITLELSVNHQVTMEWDSWSAFDALLENPKFGSLRMVDIVIERRPRMYVSVVLNKSELETAAKAAVEKLRGNLPSLERSGKLKISFTEFDYYDIDVW